MRLIPYLLLPNAAKSRVQKVLEEHALDEGTLDAAVVLLEEMGSDAAMIQRALAQEEQSGVMRDGTFRDLVEVMEGNAPDVDWTKIPRRGRRL